MNLPETAGPPEKVVRVIGKLLDRVDQILAAQDARLQMLIHDYYLN